MATQLRDFAPGQHHVWVNATGNEPYFVDEIDRMTWIRGVVRMTAEHGLTCLAFCQMTTHTHLLLDVPDQSLPAAIQRLNADYSRRFNIRHDRVGQFVRRRYCNRRIEGAKDLLGTFAYVVLNSVKAGLCPRAEDWRWSSLASTLGITDDFPFVDASLVLSEVNNSTDELRALVDARWREYLAAKALSDRLTRGRGPWGQVLRP